jgi:hypothetical protein
MWEQLQVPIVPFVLYGAFELFPKSEPSLSMMRFFPLPSSLTLTLTLTHLQTAGSTPPGASTSDT